jgi:tetratricopeptide (TPR) repeat protein
MKKIIVIWLIVLCTALSAFLNEQMLFKEGGFMRDDSYVSVILCNRSGSELKNMDEYRDDANIYFRIKPLLDWKFSKKDDELIIKIVNDGKLKNYDATKYKVSDMNEFYIVKVSKKQFALTKPFYFENDLGRTKDITFPEEYWDYYEFAFEHFSLGSGFLKELDFFNAYKELTYFMVNDFTKQFSFYEEAVELLEYSVGEHIQQQKKISQKFLNIKEQISSDVYNFDKSVFAEMDTFALNQLEPIKFFDKYFVSGLEKSSVFKKEYTEFSKEMNTLLSESIELYKTTLFSLFIGNDYNNSKFYSFIDILARSMCYLDSIPISEPTVVINPENFYRFPKQMSYIRRNGWEKELAILVESINSNIKIYYHVLDKPVTDNLFRNIDNEPQPYYNIFSAFNALCSGEYNAVLSSLDEALQKCTDPEFIDNICLLKASYISYMRNIDSKITKSLNIGLLHERNNELAAAEIEYQKAANRSVNYALPNFYLGRTYYKKNNKPNSELYINRALEIDSKLVEARLFKIDALIEEQNFSSALQDINTALQTNPIYRLYYLRALSLFKLERYDEAAILVLQTCIELNPHDIYEYLLLGDIYKALGDGDASKKYYLEAGKIDPENEDYLERINGF